MHSSTMRTARSSSRLLEGVCLSACWDTPQAWTQPPPGVCLETPPPDPSTSPTPCGPGDPPNQTPQPPLGLGLETSLPVDRQTRVKT